jgi:hypothetical protein
MLYYGMRGSVVQQPLSQCGVQEARGGRLMLQCSVRLPAGQQLLANKPCLCISAGRFAFSDSDRPFLGLILVLLRMTASIPNNSGFCSYKQQCLSQWISQASAAEISKGGVHGEGPGLQSSPTVLLALKCHVWTPV